MSRRVDERHGRWDARGDLQFVPFSPDLEKQFHQIVVQTYSDSLDCPELDGMRPVEEVLEGYRGAGEFREAHWSLVRQAGNFVGCVFLGYFPFSKSAALQYMGVIPSHRRRGIARELVRHALQVANESGASRMSLAVDSRNAPAWRLYEELGFEETGRRSVFIIRVADD
jgi:ribosomal protein S18 acetylase RimI-like enzyme